jgi:hypothetical protein
VPLPENLPGVSGEPRRRMAVITAVSVHLGRTNVPPQVYSRTCRRARADAGCVARGPAAGDRVARPAVAHRHGAVRSEPRSGCGDRPPIAAAERLVEATAIEFTRPESPAGCMISLAATHVPSNLHSIRDTMMILPRPAVFVCGLAACAQTNALVRLVSPTLRASSRCPRVRMRGLRRTRRLRRRGAAALHLTIR